MKPDAKTPSPGLWGDRRIVSERWLRRSTVPSQPFNKRYGLLWWLYDKPAGFAAPVGSHRTGASTGSFTLNIPGRSFF